MITVYAHAGRSGRRGLTILSELEKREREIERLVAGLTALVNCKSPLTRAQMREAAQDILNGRAGSWPDQSLFVARADAAEAEIEGWKQGWSDIYTTRKISHNEARAIAQRFINSLFSNPNGARVRIPADPENDDDLLLGAYIEQQAASPSPTPQEGEWRKAVIAAVASSHKLQDGRHDTPEDYVLVDEKAIMALNALLCSTPTAKGE